MDGAPVLGRRAFICRTAPLSCTTTPSCNILDLQFLTWVSSSRSYYKQTCPLTVRDPLPIPVSGRLNKGGILLRGPAHAAAIPPGSTRLPHPTERTPISCSLDRSSHSPRVLPKKKKKTSRTFAFTPNHDSSLSLLAQHPNGKAVCLAFSPHTIVDACLPADVEKIRSLPKRFLLPFRGLTLVCLDLLD
jgi:hypothetical protein